MSRQYQYAVPFALVARLPFLCSVTATRWTANLATCCDADKSCPDAAISSDDRRSGAAPFGETICGRAAAARGAVSRSGPELSSLLGGRWPRTVSRTAASAGPIAKAEVTHLRPAGLRHRTGHRARPSPAAGRPTSAPPSGRTANCGRLQRHDSVRICSTLEFRQTSTAWRCG